MRDVAAPSERVVDDVHGAVASWLVPNASAVFDTRDCGGARATRYVPVAPSASPRERRLQSESLRDGTGRRRLFTRSNRLNPDVAQVVRFDAPKTFHAEPHLTARELGHRQRLLSSGACSQLEGARRIARRPVAKRHLGIAEFATELDSHRAPDKRHHGEVRGPIHRAIAHDLFEETDVLLGTHEGQAFHHADKPELER